MIEKNTVQVNIQGLRFLAALSVVIYHVAPHYVAAGGSDNVFLQWISLTAYAGVDIFFVISGYIIWISTGHVSGLQGASDFLRRRAIRIYSGYWPYLLILSLVLMVYGVSDAREIDVVGSIFLTQSKHEKLLLPVAWSLVYELYFYIGFSVLLILPRRYAKVFLYAVMAAVLLTLLMVWCADVVGMRKKFKWFLKASHFFLSPFLAEFCAGCVLAIFLESGKKINIVLCVVVAMTFLVLAVMYQLHSGQMADSLLNYPHVRVAFFGPVAVFLVAMFSGAEMRGKVFFRKASLLLGGASYSLYLSHTIIFDAFYLSGLRSLVGESWHAPLLFVVLALLFTLGYSVWHYRYIETPLMNFAQRWRIR